VSVGMCKNCQHWGSTDQVWGECRRIKSDYGYEIPDGRRAAINLDTWDGTAELWSAYDFGCREWSKP